MKRITKPKKGCGLLSSNVTFFSDSCFGGVKISEEENSEVVGYCSPENTIHKEFFLAMLEDLIKQWLVGSHLFMKGDPIVTGCRPLMAIGYRYIYQRLLGFISMYEPEVLNQVLPIHLITLTNILIFLFTPLSILKSLAGASVPLIQQTTPIVCGSLTQNQRNIG